MKNQHSSSGILKRFILWTVMTLTAVIITLFIPLKVWSLTSHPQPVQGYEEAIRRIAILQTGGQSEMNPDCLLQFLTHGQKVQKVIILVHGYTNCPAQFGALGQRFYDLGFNVLIAPLPQHGLADRMNNEQSQLTADELTIYADQMVDIANGLGEQISMMGISGGGVTTAWAAQNRSDLDTAVIISPAFGYGQIPTRLTAPVMNILLVLPNTYEWWDPQLKENIGPSHAYPRYSKRALAEILQLGFAVRVRGWQGLPAAHRVVVVTNANDTDVNNALTVEIVQRWQKNGATIETFEFPVNLGLEHDLIDPEQPDQQSDIVYPQLIDLVTDAE